MLKVIENMSITKYVIFCVLTCFLSIHFGKLLVTEEKIVKESVYGNPFTVVYIEEKETIPFPPKIPQKKIEKYKFEKVAKFVIVNLEGGDQIANEPNGGIAKYGFNSKAHPTLDIRNLTKQKALYYARKKYWDTVNADELSLPVRVVAFDMAFHHGPSFAKRILQKENDCPETILELRRQEYKRLINANPQKYSKFQKGWENRLRKVEEYI